LLGSKNKEAVIIIGGGLAGCEAASMIARFGHPVLLYEMKPKKFSPAHQREGLAEIVCSNSLGAEEEGSAPGLLKYEMKQLGSVILEAANQSRVPAGKALAVDRDRFSEITTEVIHRQPLIKVIREECEELPKEGLAIVATGPLTSESLASDLAGKIGTDTLYFYDSISPIVTADSIDYSKTYFASRYENDSSDYLNCPMDRETYDQFVKAILMAEKVPVRHFEALKCFEACLPIEVLVERGHETLAFGPMKPVGLVSPRTGKKPHALVQLRRENIPTTLYNLVGFQTRMKWGEQKRIFRMIPGLENAEFVRFGSMHRNTYLNSPKVLHLDLSLKVDQRILIAGQITGVEGYVESAAMGQWTGLVALARLRGVKHLPVPPKETAIGALLRAVTTTPLHGVFSPMNINFGLFPPLEASGGKEVRRRLMVERARKASDRWKGQIFDAIGEMETPSGHLIQLSPNTHADLTS